MQLFVSESDVSDSDIASIIQPARARYTQMDLGIRDRKIRETWMRRDDFAVMNARREKLECSLYFPREAVENYKTGQFNDENHRVPTHTQGISKYTNDLVFVYLHGSSGCRMEANPIVQLLIPQNCAVCAYDAAGCGLSQGTHVTLGLREHQDLAHVLDYLQKNYGYRHAILWGRSMGAVTALLYAQEQQQQQSLCNSGQQTIEIVGLVCDSAFSSFERVCKEMVSKRVISMLCSAITEQVRKKLIKALSGLDLFKLDPSSCVSMLTLPAVFMYSDADTLLPPGNHSQVLQQKYAGEKKTVKFSGNHNAMRETEALKEAFTFLEMHLKQLSRRNERNGQSNIIGIQQAVFKAKHYYHRNNNHNNNVNQQMKQEQQQVQLGCQQLQQQQQQLQLPQQPQFSTQVINGLQMRCQPQQSILNQPIQQHQRFYSLSSQPQFSIQDQSQHHPIQQIQQQFQQKQHQSKILLAQQSFKNQQLQQIKQIQQQSIYPQQQQQQQQQQLRQEQLPQQQLQIQNQQQQYLFQQQEKHKEPAAKQQQLTQQIAVLNSPACTMSSSTTGSTNSTQPPPPVPQTQCRSDDYQISQQRVSTTQSNRFVTDEQFERYKQKVYNEVVSRRLSSQAAGAQEQSSFQIMNTSFKSTQFRYPSPVQQRQTQSQEQQQQDSFNQRIPNSNTQMNQTAAAQSNAGIGIQNYGLSAAIHARISQQAAQDQYIINPQTQLLKLQLNQQQQQQHQTISSASSQPSSPIVLQRPASYFPQASSSTNTAAATTATPIYTVPAPGTTKTSSHPQQMLPMQFSTTQENFTSALQARGAMMRNAACIPEQPGAYQINANNPQKSCNTTVLGSAELRKSFNKAQSTFQQQINIQSFIPQQDRQNRIQDNNMVTNSNSRSLSAQVKKQIQHVTSPATATIGMISSSSAATTTSMPGVNNLGQSNHNKVNYLAQSLANQCKWTQQQQLQQQQYQSAGLSISSEQEHHHQGNILTLR